MQTSEMDSGVTETLHDCVTHMQTIPPTKTYNNNIIETLYCARQRRVTAACGRIQPSSCIVLNRQKKRLLFVHCTRQSVRIMHGKHFHVLLPLRFMDNEVRDTFLCLRTHQCTDGNIQKSMLVTGRLQAP